MDKITGNKNFDTKDIDFIIKTFGKGPVGEKKADIMKLLEKQQGHFIDKQKSKDLEMSRKVGRRRTMH